MKRRPGLLLGAILARPLLTLGVIATGYLSTAHAELLAHWPLDTDATDATGNGHDGAVVGGTVTFGQPGANGNTGTSAAFPDNGHIDVPFDAALNPGTQGVDGSGSFTIALWANSSNNSGFNSPFTAREDNGTSVNGPIIYNNPDGNWSYWAGNFGPPGAWNAFNDGPVPLDTWVHVAITYDSDSTTRKMFVDGAEVINQVIGVSPNAQRNIHIGSGQDDGNNFFWNGLIDDVGIWDEALSDTDIQSVMENGIGGGQADPNLQVRNLIELDYDGVNGDFNIEIQNTGATQDLIINGTPTVGGPDSASFSVVTVPGPIPPGGMANLEASFDPLGNNGVLEGTFDIASNDPLEANRVVTVRVTVHDPFALAPDSIDLGTLPSRSGPEVATVTIENPGSRTLMISDISVTGADQANFTVGAFSDIPGGGSLALELTFDSSGQEGTFVAELVIDSDDPITPTLTIPIIARVEFSSPLIAWWPLDEDASDASGNGFDGTVVGGTVNFGQPGANSNTGLSADFPDNGHIDVPFDTALNPGVKGPAGAESFTVALWANSSNNGGFNSPFTSREDSDSVNGPIIYNNPDGNWSYWAGNNGPSGAWNGINDGPVPLDTWVHVAINYDSVTTTRKMYIDGVEVINQVVGVSANSQRDLHIGAGQDDGNNFFWNGLIDDVGLFRVALTEEEINDIMNNGVQSILGTQKLFLDVSAIGADMLTFRWASKDGSLYNLRSETDLSIEPETWPIFDGQQDLVATAPENTLTIPRPADPERFFVIEEFPAPPVSVFSDDFESGQGGWTTGSEGAAGTDWELGSPTVVGPPAANSPDNCFGTNLAADYAFDANIWLRSPAIDLTTAGGATLTYFNFIDIEQGFDFGTVSVLDAADDSELAVIAPTIDGLSTGWEEVTRRLPAEALGKTIKLEFRFQSDNLENFAGWYLDDVVVTVP